MFTVNQSENQIAFTISSEMSLVDRVISESVEFIKELQIQKFDNLKMILRELMINAIEHGNNNQIQMEVNCQIEYLENSRFKIMVTDQGDGFEYEDLDLRIPDNPDQTRSRGLSLVNALADEMKFNDVGNEITVYLTLITSTEFKVEQEDDYQIIIPNGDITASCADKFRVIMLELLDNDYANYKFDFKEVEDIDSISLSLLITFSKMLKKKFPNGQLNIVNANQDLANLFNLTRLNKIYNITNVRG